MSNYTKNHKGIYVKPESEYHMFDWAKKAFIDNYANFTGRARRSEYWYAVLSNIIIQFSLLILAVVLVLISEELAVVTGIIYIIWIFYALALFIPSLALAVRRLHDVGKSGWFYFISLIPLVGPIVLIVTLATDSEPGENKWGPNPKNIGNNEFDLIGKE